MKIDGSCLCGHIQYEAEVELLCAHRLDRLCPVGGKADVKIERLQDRRDDRLIGEVVLNHECAAANGSNVNLSRQVGRRVHSYQSFYGADNRAKRRVVPK